MTKFYKLQGAGNDYLFFDCFEKILPEPEKVAKALSSRRFSVGADGIILLERSPKADANMRIFNADGSEGKMCGNGVRCAARYLYDIKKLQKAEYSIQTLSGVKRVFCENSSDTLRFTVDMGEPKIEALHFPVSCAGKEYDGASISMGNPHLVLFLEDVEHADVEKVGNFFQENPYFSGGVNVEFVDLISPCALKMRVYERGSGETFACGTGACAAAVAAVYRKNAEKRLRVFCRGGELEVLLQNEKCFLSGGAEVCFSGEVEIK